MASSVNKVILVGSVGRDPEIRNTQGGSKIASFSLATSESWKDRSSGERREKTEWHKVVVFNEALVGVVERFVRKGGKLYVEGALETRKWTDQSGAEKYTTEVVLKQFRGELTLLDSRNTDHSGGDRAPESSNGGRQTQQPQRGSGAARPAHGQASGAHRYSDFAGPGGHQGSYGGDSLEDEIPF